MQQISLLASRGCLWYTKQKPVCACMMGLLPLCCGIPALAGALPLRLQQGLPHFFPRAVGRPSLPCPCGGGYPSAAARRFWLFLRPKPAPTGVLCNTLVKSLPARRCKIKKAAPFWRIPWAAGMSQAATCHFHRPVHSYGQTHRHALPARMRYGQTLWARGPHFITEKRTFYGYTSL